MLDRLRTAETWPGRLAVLDRWLVVALREPRARFLPAPELRHCWHLLRTTGGRIPVRLMARETGWSERHLRERMRVETGLSPVVARRVFRLNAARARLQGADLVTLAAEHGYADQAHLAREFRALAGCAPSVLRAGG